MSIKCSDMTVLDDSLVEFLTNLVEQTQDAILCVDAKYTIVLYNPAAEKVFGWSAAEILGTRVNKILPIHNTNKSRTTMTGITKDGTRVSLDVALSSMTLNGHECHAAIVRKVSKATAEIETYRKETKRQLLKEVDKVIKISGTNRCAAST